MCSPAVLQYYIVNCFLFQLTSIVKDIVYVDLKFGHFSFRKIEIVDFWTNDFIFDVNVMILYIGVCNYIDVLVRAWLTFKQEPPCLRDLDHIHDEIKSFMSLCINFFFHWRGSVIGCCIQSDSVVEKHITDPTSQKDSWTK